MEVVYEIIQMFAHMCAATLHNYVLCMSLMQHSKRDQLTLASSHKVESKV